jgi:serine O-acetyltransferase
MRSGLEALLCCPGLHAITCHRVAHWMWEHRAWFLARLLAHITRFWTGVDIHPGACIGARCFIDHGAGVVIGETCCIGNDVIIYHGVTLGSVRPCTGRRHPTIEDGVMLGAGAKVLGPITVHRFSRIGANAVVLRDVPPHATAVGVPARIIPGTRELQLTTGEPMEAESDATLRRSRGRPVTLPRE